MVIGGKMNKTIRDISFHDVVSLDSCITGIDVNTIKPEQIKYMIEE